MKGRIAVFLFRDIDYQFFAEKIFPKNNVTVLALFQKLPSKKKYVYGLKAIIKFLKKEEKVKLIFFDFYPLVISSITSLCLKNGIKTYYIQHGYLDTSNKASILSRLNFLFDNIRLYKTYLLEFGINFTNINNILLYLRHGGYQGFKLSSQKVFFTAAYFWDKSSLRLFQAYENALCESSHILGGPDKLPSFLKYCKNGFVVYVTQPLFLTNHMTFNRFCELLKAIKQEYGNEDNLILLFHPKLKLYESYFSKYYNIIYVNDINHEILASKIIGHFSSLLMYKYEDIEVKISSFGFDEIAKEVTLFKEKRSLNQIDSNPIFFNSLNKILLNQ